MLEEDTVILASHLMALFSRCNITPMIFYSRRRFMEDDGWRHVGKSATTDDEKNFPYMKKGFSLDWLNFSNG